MTVEFPVGKLLQGLGCSRESVQMLCLKLSMEGGGELWWVCTIFKIEQLSLTTGTTGGSIYRKSVIEEC